MVICHYSAMKKIEIPTIEAVEAANELSNVGGNNKFSTFARRDGVLSGVGAGGDSVSSRSSRSKDSCATGEGPRTTITTPSSTTTTAPSFSTTTAMETPASSSSCNTDSATSLASLQRTSGNAGNARNDILNGNASGSASQVGPSTGRSTQAAVTNKNSGDHITHNNNRSATAAAAATTSSGPAPDQSNDGDAACASGGSPKKATKPASTTPLLINGRRQGNNPVLRFVRSVPYQMAEDAVIKADFDLGSGACCLFLSLKFHKLNPDYIETRFRDVGHSYACQVLLVMIDVDEPKHLLQELNKFCYNAGWCLVPCYSIEEAAEYLELFKINERKVAEIVSDLGRKALAMKPAPKNAVSLTVAKDKQEMCDSAVHLLSSIRGVNRSDARRLLGTFGSLKNIGEASVDRLTLCPGLGVTKAQNIHAAFREPFVKELKKSSSYTRRRSPVAAASSSSPLADD